MKKLIITTLVLPISLLAQSFLISNIPIPKTYIQNLDPYPCNEECLQEYLDNDMIFSFLSHIDSKLDNQRLDDARMMNVSILNLGSNVITDKIKIALLLPYKIIGKYASSTTNASFAYLIAKNRSFELKSYKIDDEKAEDIKNAIDKIRDDGFSYVIAPLTSTGANIVSELDPKINIYFPTINKRDINTSSSFLYYGGIDYKAQNDMLLKESVSPLIIFYDKSTIGNNLAEYQESRFKEINIIDRNYTAPAGDDSVQNYNKLEVETDTLSQCDDKSVRYLSEDEKKVIKFSIPKRTTNLENQLKENAEINNGSFILNTPIVKSGMIMSQLTLFDANTTNVLSTQVNYDPLILSMTQYKDRKEMIIANSITSKNNVLIETNSVLGNDILYDWINYTTTVGVDYFFNIMTQENREYAIDLHDNQMMYPIELLKPSRSKFIHYQKQIEESSL